MERNGRRRRSIVTSIEPRPGECRPCIAWRKRSLSRRLSKKAKQSFLATHGISNIAKMSRTDFMDGVRSMIAADNGKAYRILYNTLKLFEGRLRRDEATGAPAGKNRSAVDKLTEAVNMALLKHCKGGR